MSEHMLSILFKVTMEYIFKFVLQESEKKCLSSKTFDGQAVIIFSYFHVSCLV